MSAAIGKAAMATPPMVTQHRSVSLGSATSTGSRASPSLLAEPPLRRVSSFLEEPSSPSVTVRLQEPFWSSMAHVRLLVRAVQLQTLLESETGGPSSRAPHRLDELCASHPNIAQLLDEFYQEVATLQGGEADPMPLMEATGLSAMCPLVAHYLGDPERSYRRDDVPNVREYLEHVSALNQLLVIATQLRDDVVAKRHKYTAHKIALLYHAINNTKMSRDVSRSRALRLHTTDRF